jgi:glycosyltransferase involved in cell wall biosynthesis
MYDFLVPAVYVIKSWLLPYDAIVFNTAYQGAFAALFRGKTMSVIGGFLFLDRPKKTIFDRYSHILYWLCIRGCDVAIGTTPENKHRIENRYGVTAECIPLGVSDDMTSESATSKSTGKVIGYIGAYNARKRPEYLLELINLENADDITLLLAGRMSADFRSKLDRALQSSVAKVEILGEISEAKKVDFYRRLNFLYFPTSWEGFGLPMAEAMKCGVVPIIHADAQIPALLKKQCVNVSGPKELVEQVEAFASSPARYRRALSDNSAYAQQFNWSNYADYIVAGNPKPKVAAND